jgi:hypothetical protein
VTERVKPRSATTLRPPDFVELIKAKLVESMRLNLHFLRVFVGYRPNPEVQQTSDCRSEARFAHTLDHYRALGLRGGSETRILSRNQKDLGSKFPEVKDLSAQLREHANFG